MCGFVGFVGGTDNPIRGAHQDDGPHRPSRSRHGRSVYRRPRCPGLPPPVDPRPDRGRRSTHGQRGRQRRHCLQRRDLQLPRTPFRARGQGLQVPLRRRHREPPARLRGVGRGRPRSPARYVRLRHLGQKEEQAFWRPRHLWHQAALLLSHGRCGRRRSGRALWFRDQELPGLPALPQGGQQKGSASVHDAAVFGD